MKLNKKFTFKIILMFIVVIILASLPVIFVVISSLISESCGCVLNEATVHPCQVLGVEIGGILSFMFISGWFALTTIPLGLVLLLLLTIYSVINRKKFIYQN